MAIETNHPSSRGHARLLSRFGQTQQRFALGHASAFKRDAPAPMPKTSDGAITLRRLTGSDSVLLRDHLLRLDKETRRLRFGTMVNDPFLVRYASLALVSDAHVRGVFVEGVLRGVSELRFLTGSHQQAEAAFSIEKAYQGRGLGDLLFAKLVAAARNRGVRRLFLTCLRENGRMQAIAAKHGADLSFHEGDVMAELRRPYADLTSIQSELADEAQAYVFALIDWRRDRWRSLTAPLKRFGDALSGRIAGH
ncbi:MAG: GNAT family N-acetyltransferase [Fulvimarina manganoxydans]|uniref:GNAT family N-acetyltransferase n=1 Tax=Fulvimarina manganoxydans TaxID=937218 RepID=UPI0023579291|nr:GNAT family N-acetyltransferase [Fulvimarina manganoxydans]MCK5931067.1 GNAT family N-acetyltransferase [Fulvimarina manganoxydans]